MIMKYLNGFMASFKDDLWESYITHDVLETYKQLNFHDFVNNCLNITFACLGIFIYFKIDGLIGKLIFLLIYNFFVIICFHMIDAFIVTFGIPWVTNRRNKSLKRLKKHEIKLMNYFDNLERFCYSDGNTYSEKCNIKASLRSTRRKIDELENLESNIVQEKEVVSSVVNKQNIENIKFLKEKLNVLTSIDVPEQYKEKKEKILKFSGYVIFATKENPILFKFISKTFNIHISKLAEVLTYVSKQRDQSNIEKYDDDINEIMDNIIKRLVMHINDIKKHKDDEFYFTLKILKEDLLEYPLSSKGDDN